jgi:two-component system chemotaxis response regulator CheY
MALKASMKILIADESASNRQVLRRMLTEIGFKNVGEVGDGDKAWEEVLNPSDKTGVEFLISTWDLPKASGLDLLKKIRADEKHAKLPFLMVTSDGDQKNVLTAVKAGVSNVLLRPFSAQSLIEKIDKIFNKKK